MSEMQLKECPFCGGNNLTLENLVDENDYSVECEDCQLGQHAVHTKESAIKTWNTRAQPAVDDAALKSKESDNERE